MEALPRKDVLVVDDDGGTREMLRVALGRLDLTCDIATDGATAQNYLRRACYDVILTDIVVPKRDGIGLVQALEAAQCEPAERAVIIVMTAFPDRVDLPEIAELVQAVIRKPFHLRELAEVVQSCVAMRRLHEARVLHAPRRKPRAAFK